ncbi:LuxR family transcriptional regulator [Mycolicibacterium aurum]|uniref:LuxR family transcriptional regulator n=1 Tax=Mycolicibacterium aurum TaxID=1791 RepID=A0A3S4RTD2_MYCAU|nr:LuxR family transcriptional regulator [Mycolicibacterium aurum]VEG54979.1 LuxR family transcriptional regulator [Mycolicibacterium aurum]
MTAIRDRSNAVLPGRVAECQALLEMVDALRSGRSEVRVLVGEAGIGKTALLTFLRQGAADCTVLTALGVESDMELAFAGLQQLCAPVLDYRTGLPQPQREALERAFGLSDTGPAPNRFLVGLAVLGLLAAAAADRPVLCVIDDVQWLDHVSAQTLFFIARRVQAESLGLAFASRTPIEGTAGLPTMTVGGLDDGTARTLLESAFPGRLDAAILDRIVAEARGNPLALLETSKDIMSWHTPTVSAGVEEHYRAQIADLPDDTRMLLLVAAAEPVGDPALLSRASAHLDLKPAVMTRAHDLGLIAVDTRVQFCHPLARSVAYRSATAEQRRLAHAALAAVTDPAVDPDRRAWHRALAADSLDEQVALDLELSAGRATQRGGTASAAAFLTRAVELTPDSSARTGRALAAAEAHREIASFDSARRLLAVADLGPLTDLQQARSAQLRTRLAFASARADGDADELVAAVAQFTAVAGQLDALDDTLATEAYLEALTAAMYVGRIAEGLAAGVAETARAALATRQAKTPLDLVTHALAERLAVGAVEAMPAMRRALDALKVATRDGGHGWFWRAFPLVHDCLIHETWDDGWRDISAHAVRLATDSGALALLPSALLSRAGAAFENGELASASAFVAEANDLAIAIDYAPLKYHRIMVAAWRGDEAETTRLATEALESGRSRGEGRVIGLALYATVVLNVGLGRYADALASARQAAEYDDLGFYPELLAEMVEAGVRGEDREVAEQAFDRLRDRTRAAGTPRALGSLARSQALLSSGKQAEALYQESIGYFEATSQRIQLARARLLHGEWLRRNGPVTAARGPLRLAQQEFVQMGSMAFAERARRELQAAGEKTRKQPTTAGDELSPQERQIAELAGQGLTNQEIAGQLFISAHTVEWHLRKVFTKLGIRSRRELRRRFH